MSIKFIGNVEISIILLCTTFIVQFVYIPQDEHLLTCSMKGETVSTPLDKDGNTHKYG